MSLITENYHSISSTPFPVSPRGEMLEKKYLPTWGKARKGVKTFPKIFLIILIFFVISAELFSQEKAKSITLNGYLTTMQSVMFDSLSGPFMNENLLHNRLNFKGYLNSNVSFAAEFRNRLFTGDLVRLGKHYTGLIGADQGMVDMSWNIVEKQSFLLNTTIDRLWLDFHFSKIQATIGRQRINWGQTFVWNPNDIFNAYSFFDFDYVERPGSDAVRLTYSTGPSSAAETVVKLNSENEITAAALYRFSILNTDLQFLAGETDEELFTAGMGGSG